MNSVVLFENEIVVVRPFENIMNVIYKLDGSSVQIDSQDLYDKIKRLDSLELDSIHLLNDVVYNVDTFIYLRNKFNGIKKRGVTRWLKKFEDDELFFKDVRQSITEILFLKYKI